MSSMNAFLNFSGELSQLVIVKNFLRFPCGEILRFLMATDRIGSEHCWLIYVVLWWAAVMVFWNFFCRSSLLLFETSKMIFLRFPWIFLIMSNDWIGPVQCWFIYSTNCCFLWTARVVVLQLLLQGMLTGIRTIEGNCSCFLRGNCFSYWVLIWLCPSSADSTAPCLAFMRSSWHHFSKLFRDIS